MTLPAIITQLFRPDRQRILRQAKRAALDALNTHRLVRHDAIIHETALDLVPELKTFSGTERHYRHAFGLQYTEGVFHIAFRSESVRYDSEHACSGAYWLLSEIAIHQPRARELTDGFQLWTLTVHPHGPMRGAVLTCRADTGVPPVITERIAWTDFPLPELTLYVIDNTLLLPGEY
jgi:hypothetical protein